jgi:hypothetical protein
MKEIRPKGKSRVNEMFRELMKEKGIEPCPLCTVPSKWDIYHTPEHPCDKRPGPSEEAK